MTTKKQQPSTLNIELFKKIRQRIIDIPASYNQRNWIEDEPTAPCGTTACLAGEAIICASVNVKAGIRRLRRLADTNSSDNPKINPLFYDSKVPQVAGKLLGMTPQEQLIFNGPRGAEWPQPWRGRWLKATGDRDAEREVALSLLDRIIKTGKIPQ